MGKASLGSLASIGAARGVRAGGAVLLASTERHETRE